MKNQARFFPALLLLLVLLTSVFILLIDKASTADAASQDITKDEIRQQLGNVDASIEKIHISGWAKIKGGEDNKPDLMKEAEKVLSLLGENASAEIHSDKKENYTSIKLSAGIDGINYTIKLYESNDAYVFAEASLDSDNIIQESMAYEKIEHILKTYEEKPEIGTTYTATILGRLEKTEMIHTAKKLFNNLNTEITELSSDTRWVSLTGFSSRLNSRMESEKGRFNLNIALRNHSDDNKTLIYLGTPVISIPY